MKKKSMTKERKNDGEKVVSEVRYSNNDVFYDIGANSSGIG
ncbi:MAG: hypothetical protein PHU31_07565 [Anaerotignum sp.]|nr:hypothetical protein [Anaerotignum sp.]